MKKIFITGISGLLGTNLANALLEQGYHLTAVIRKPGRYAGNKTERLRLIPMDLWGDYDSYLQEADVVVHIAAETATDLIRYSDYDKINYQATIRLFEKAEKLRVPQFIFISTANTIGYGDTEFPGSELQKIKKPFLKLFYAQSKLKAEKFLLSRESQMQVKILNPTFIIGPHDIKPTSGRLILMALNKRLVFCPPGGKNFVPVKDVVAAIILAFERGGSGERYLIAGENLSYKAFFAKLGKITNQKQLLIPVPAPVLLIAGFAGEILRFFNLKTHLSLSNMKALCTKCYYGNQKSVSELGIEYSSLDTAVEESVAYFKRNRKHERK